MKNQGRILRSWCGLLLLALTISDSVLFSQSYYLFIGTYTGAEGGKGIHVCKFNSEKGTLKLISYTTGVINPSWLNIAPDGKYIYACTETKMPGAGSVSAFSFNPKTGKLGFLNKQPAGGENPVYLSVHRSGKWLVNANYTSGSIAVFPISENGSLQPYEQLIQYADSSVNKARQDKSHVHAVVFSPGYDQLFVTDLGADKIRVYNTDTAAKAQLVSAEPGYTAAFPGSGPRHFSFHPNGKFAYCIEEMGGAVSAYSYRNDQLQTIQRIAAHDTGSQGSYESADIHLTPDGKFLYASNRGSENSIAIFSVNQEDGTLKLLGCQSTLGQSPRNFNIDPTGKYLLVANVATSNVVVFKRDLQTGMLKPTGIELSVRNPSCLQFLEMEK